MKNNYLILFIMAIFCAGTLVPVAAQNSPTASKDIYDWTPFEDVKMVELFYQAIQNGRNYPTSQEFRDVFGFDIEFARSHVRPHAVMADQTKQVDPSIDPKRNLWMNLPTGIGSMVGGYPDDMFINDVYSMWQYTKLFGSWNHGLFQAPGAWADAAHKHGTDIFSGIKFFESWNDDGGEGAYQGLITAKEQDGSYKYAEAFINCLMYLGLDGINYNWEAQGYTQPDVIAFHKELFRIADEKGFENFHIGLYTSTSTMSSWNASNLYYGHDPSKKTIDLMLNYMSGDFSSGYSSSIAAAESVGQTDHLYSGVWIVNMDRNWPMMNQDAAKKMNLCLWGEHGQSRFMSYNSGSDGFDIQENYQKLLEKAFSGGNRNPANKPALSSFGNNWEGENPLGTFGGLATMIAERPTVQGKLPFVTNFQLGNGERYNYKGKMAFGEWYNMGAQDYQPTYRWLVYNAGTEVVSSDIEPYYTHRDAYTGGSALALKGTATSGGTDIVLYRTDLEITEANPKINIAVKTFKEGTTATNLHVILKKLNSNTWEEIPVGATSGKEWEEKVIDMSSFIAGDHIEYIGLRVKAEATVSDYNVYVGKLGLSDDRLVKVAEIEDLLVEVKEETQKSMSLKLNWKISPLVSSSRAQETGLVYNDEANVDHFEIVYKNGANGRVKELGRTSTWSNFIGGLIFDDEQGKDEPYIGVRAASIDGKSYSHVRWVKVARADEGQLPEFVDDRYCSSEINTASEGVDIARAQRYLEVVRTEGLADNLNYAANSPVADGTQYANATNYSFTANQGETFNFFFKAFDTSNATWQGVAKTDGLRWCFAKAYVDWDNNGVFDPTTEEVFDLGTVRKGTPEFETTGVTQTFTVPERAAPGAVRLRVVFSDAWFTHPGPCGLTAKGFSIDFTMNITGTNEPIVVEDHHDEGTPEEPERINDENPNAPDSPTDVSEEVIESAFSSFYPNPAKDIIYFDNVQQVWIYDLTGKMVITDKADMLDQMEIDFLDPGIYIVRMMNNNVIRTQKMIVR